VKLLFPIFALFLFFKLCIAEEDFRTWTSSDGRPLQARFIEQVGGSVRIKNEAGREFTLPITRFSQADQEYVVEVAARPLFQTPEPFDDQGKGAIIIASAKGKVMVIPILRYSGSKEVKPVARDVIVGEPFPHGSTIITGANAEADLLLTTGSLAKIGPNSKLVLSAFWQKDFRASAKKVNDLKEETSPSRVAFRLETGDLVVDVKKLNRESSFTIESELGVAGIRGTQFGLSANSDSAELAVLEGRVGFLDANQKAKSLATAQKIAGSANGAGEVDALPESEKLELAKAVADCQESASDYDLTRLANTVGGFAPKPNYIVKSALNMELIWCPPGSFIMGPNANDDPSHPVVLTHGFYLGKFEVTQQEYEKVMGNNPSKFKGDKLPVESISWNDAVSFCEALDKKERTSWGWKFGLPTEAQWEYACRANTTTTYNWGNSLSILLANYLDSGKKMTVEIGSYPPNSWGFHDMHGNVREWVADYLETYQNNRVVDPRGAITGEKNVQRGGSWGNVGSFMSSRRRGNGPSEQGSQILGFRLCLAPAR
jgi:formylglycine-generating enzyme required for sulfatase activity